VLFRSCLVGFHHIDILYFVFVLKSTSESETNTTSEVGLM